MLDQEQIDKIMANIEKQDGNVIFLEEIYKEPEIPVPDLFSILKVLFGFKS